MDSLFCHLTYPNKKYLKKNELTKSKRKIICNYYQLSYTHVFETFVMITNISFIEIKTLVSHHHHQTNWAFYCLLTKKTTKKDILSINIPKTFFLTPLWIFAPKSYKNLRPTTYIFLLNMNRFSTRRSEPMRTTEDGNVQVVLLNSAYHLLDPFAIDSPAS